MAQSTSRTDSPGSLPGNPREGGGAPLSGRVVLLPRLKERDRIASALERAGAPTRFHGSPNEVPDPIPFAAQTEAGDYAPEHATAFWQAMVDIDRVFTRFRSGFLGKVSPVHFFWGSFDLAVTRFSGRTAPAHPGGFPALPDTVTMRTRS
mgnify:CR=1 FL=1